MPIVPPLRSSAEATRQSPQAVVDLFTRVAPGYDRLNHLLCGGLDLYWRWCLIRAVRAQKPARLLDLATGSGDVLRAAHRAKAFGTLAAGADFCLPMLAKAHEKNVPNLLAADALQLPFHDRTWDAATVSFGLRNFTDRLAGLRELHRLLRPGGRLYVLEFSHPVRPFAALYFWYLRHLMPLYAQLFTRERGAYAYLAESIQEFPRQAALAELLRAAGFTGVTWKNLTFGVVALHIGEA